MARFKEAYKLVNLGTFPSLGQVTDLTSSLEKVSKNGVLDLQEIYDFVINLSVISDVKKFIASSKLLEEEFFYTYKFINMLDPIYELHDQILLLEASLQQNKNIFTNLVDNQQKM